MPRGVTQSDLDLRQRKEKAFEYFTKGFSNAKVTQLLNVHQQTTAGYREEYEQELQRQADANPTLLTDMLRNTVRLLQELDEVKLAAWEEHERASHSVIATCPHCNEDLEVEGVSSPSTRNQLLNTIIKAQDQRAKLLGLFGVKAEFFNQVSAVQHVQSALLQFMREQLCQEDKRKLETLLTGELAQHLTRSQSATVPALSLEAS